MSRHFAIVSIDGKRDHIRCDAPDYFARYERLKAVIAALKDRRNLALKYQDWPIVRESETRLRQAHERLVVAQLDLSRHTN